MDDSQKRKHKSHWLRIIEVVAIAIPVIFLVVSVANNIIKDHYDFILNTKRLDIGAENISVEKQKIRMQAYQKYRDEVKQISEVLSLLQIQIVSNNQFCRHFNQLPLEKQKAERQMFTKELKERKQQADKLRSNAYTQYGLLKFLFGEKAYQQAKKFLMMDKKYIDPCAADFPEESKWLEWQNAFFDALIEHVKSKYPDLSLLLNSKVDLHQPSFLSNLTSEEETDANQLI